MVILFAICSNVPSAVAILRNELLWPIRSSSRRKSSQAKDVRAAVGSRYGDVLAAEVICSISSNRKMLSPAWKRWSPILLRPEGLCGTRPAEGGSKAAKLRAIREAVRSAKRVWLATDCDREVSSSAKKFSSIMSTAVR